MRRSQDRDMKRNSRTYTAAAACPTLSFTYSGVGTSRTVYAQIVDEKTGRVLGLTVTPIPVTLNGKTQVIPSN